MKKIPYAWAYGLLAAALLFIGSGSVALAAAPSSFSTFCGPYSGQTPFVNGGYFKPAEGGACEYDLPVMTGSFYAVAIFKGTPGNATLINNDVFFVSGGVSVYDTAGGNTFGGTQGDNFFSVAFGITNYPDDFNTAVTYLETGAGSPPESLNVIQWIYGTTPVTPPPPTTTPLTVTADNKTVELGSALPTFTASLSGFVAPDTATSNDLTGSAACTSTATPTSGVGTYPITCTVGTLVSAKKYTFGTFVAGTLSIVDTTAPTVAITSPANGAVYKKNDTVFAAATATDLSPIASTVYKFNGAVINAANPIPLANAPAGTTTATLVVAATDAYGNTGYATSTFTVAPPDLNAPSITITSPVNGGIYAKTDSVFLTATVTDQSAIANTTYWFNGVKINPAVALPLANAPVVSKASVVATDIHGNTATSTVTLFVVKSTNSCLVDIITVLAQIAQDKTLPNKPTILNLIADCSALLKGKHHY